MGGEWHQDELVNKLKTAKSKGYNTCLYTGEKSVSSTIMAELTWLKTGRWIQDLGGLGAENTNQKFIEIASNKILNQQFQKA